jgi:Protein of unknown function (DUF2802)
MPSWIPALSVAQLPFPFSLELLLIVGRAVALMAALCVFAWAFSRWRRSMARDTQRVFEQLDLIQGELHGLAESVAVLAGRLEALHEKVELDAQRVPAQRVSGQPAYENAIRLAQRGASSEDLVSQCGLARHESDLLVRLHGRSEEHPRARAEEACVAEGADVAPPRKRLSVVG